MGGTRGDAPIGVLGVGRMGLSIAGRPSATGRRVRVFDVSEDRRAAAHERGLEVMRSQQEVAAGSEILVTALPGPAECEDAMIGEGGALAALPGGACWLDLTSNDPRIAHRIAQEVGFRGIDAVGAPMLGGPDDAARGTLGFCIGGTPEAIERVSALLGVLGPADRAQVVGNDIRHGYSAKLLSNTLWFGQVVAVTECLLLGVALGLDLGVLRRTLAAGPGGSTFITDHLDALLRGDYLESFGIDRVVEELETVRALAQAAGTPSELTSLVGRLHAEALDRFGPVAGELLAAKLLEERAGSMLRMP